MRQSTAAVDYVLPSGKHLMSVPTDPSTIHLYIGTDNSANSPWTAQINNQIVKFEEIGATAAAIRDKMPIDNQPQATVILRADKNVPMQLINEIKQQLRQAHLYRLVYGASEMQ